MLVILKPNIPDFRSRVPDRSCEYSSFSTL